jgi:isocitrate dehydrogenase (NAD+)
VHGSAPDIAGQNKANPLALLQSAVLMLHHIGESAAARRIHDAITKVLAAGDEVRTRDIGGTGSTTEFTHAMCEALKRGTRAGD